jgi:hypothetical protein
VADLGERDLLSRERVGEIGAGEVASVLHAQRELARARASYERAVAIGEARLGADHPDTLQSRPGLARVVAELEDRS